MEEAKNFMFWVEKREWLKKRNREGWRMEGVACLCVYLYVGRWQWDVKGYLAEVKEGQLDRCSLN
jgi:hypothetical protein